jgi:uncharacterized protein (DUF697 family)
VNQPLLLHVVERLEAFVGKLPGAIQKPILHELTPLKELFLQQRPPRLMLAGATDAPLEEVLQNLFDHPFIQEGLPGFVPNRWNDISILDHGTISIIDARGEERAGVEGELERRPPDVILFFEDHKKKKDKGNLDWLVGSADRLDKTGAQSFPVFVLLGSPQKRGEKASEILTGPKRGVVRLAGSFEFEKMQDSAYRKQFVTGLARELPNCALIEMARISKDKAVQSDIAHILVKSTTAICTAIGAQPIPLADLPILTTLQLVMVSGVMYVSGRERSLRAATEFIGALGVNVGAGMLLREGARAILKFFPGWGNIVCGAVAGAGTYAIGRAAIVFFIEGVSLKDARRTYLASRKRPTKPRLLGRKRALGLPQRNGESGDQ